VRDTLARGTYVTLSVTTRDLDESQLTAHFSVMPRVVALPLASEVQPRLRMFSIRACATIVATADWLPARICLATPAEPVARASTPTVMMMIETTSSMIVKPRRARTPVRLALSTCSFA
jgi:hypothetical protein